MRFPANRQARDGLAALIRPDPKAKILTQKQIRTATQLIAKGEYKAALVLVGSLLRLDADNPELHEMIAVCYRNQGAPAKAVAAYDRALGGLDTAALWAGKGAALMEMQRPGKAAASLRRAAAMEPGNLRHLTNIAQCERQMGQPLRALATVRGALSLQADDVPALVEEGRILAALNRAKEAMVSLRASLCGRPEDTVALDEMGMLAHAMGDRPAARTHFSEALRLKPNAAPIHRKLSLVTQYKGDEPQLAQIRRELKRPDLSDDARSHLHFALFNALDQLDDRPNAWHHLEQANALRRGVLGYDLARDVQFFDYLKKLTYSRVGQGATGPTPVFIVGLPCSGATLTEHLLAQTSEVFPSGALPVVANGCMPLLRTMLSERRTNVTALEQIALQKTLRDGLAQYANDAPALIDRMPLNFRFLGLMAETLPEAKFIVLNRDPMAVGWSLYQTYFDPPGNGFAYDLQDIARFQTAAHGLISHWKQQLGDRLIQLDYSALVTAPEAEPFRLAAACALEPRRTELPDQIIRTASPELALGEVKKDRDHAWHRYADALKPMRVSLATDGL